MSAFCQSFLKIFRSKTAFFVHFAKISRAWKWPFWGQNVPERFFRKFLEIFERFRSFFLSFLSCQGCAEGMERSFLRRRRKVHDRGTSGPEGVRCVPDFEALKGLDLRARLSECFFVFE